jgi:hypothetical protein
MTAFHEELSNLLMLTIIQIDNDSDNGRFQRKDANENEPMVVDVFDYGRGSGLLGNATPAGCLHPNTDRNG